METNSSVKCVHYGLQTLTRTRTERIKTKTVNNEQKQQQHDTSKTRADDARSSATRRASRAQRPNDDGGGGGDEPTLPRGETFVDGEIRVCFSLKSQTTKTIRAIQMIYVRCSTYA